MPQAARAASVAQAPGTGRHPAAAHTLPTPLGTRERGREASSTIEPVDGLLAQAARDAPVDPLVLVALVLQEILQQIQHLCHLQGKA